MEFSIYPPDALYTIVSFCQNSLNLLIIIYLYANTMQILLSIFGTGGKGTKAITKTATKSTMAEQYKFVA